MRFQIRRSINNIYTAISLDDGKTYTCRIKGKVLRNIEPEYSPIAVGDIAVGEAYSESEAIIWEREERKSAFTRWNAKRAVNQTIAANQSLAAIVVSPLSPPFRPRFLDRAIACVSGSDVLLIMNKSDQADDDIRQAFDEYSAIGFRTLYVSSVTGEGIEELRSVLSGNTTSFAGQSGVGKSTLINTLLGTEQRTGEVSWKYNRGKHTTNHSLYLEHDGIAVIDTPGVREIEVPFEDIRIVKESFPELRNLECGYPGCLHRGEDGCKVDELLENGQISEERYESYLRILSTLEERVPFYMRDKRNTRR